MIVNCCISISCLVWDNFSELSLVGLVYRMINFCCTNLDHTLSYLESLAFTDLWAWIIIVRVESLIVSSSQNMFAIHFYALLWHHPTELWVVCNDFYTQLPLFNYWVYLKMFCIWQLFYVLPLLFCLQGIPYGTNALLLNVVMIDPLFRCPIGVHTINLGCAPVLE